MIYVLPTPPELRGRLLDHSRLYAYPAIPEPPPTDGFIILDSGAYALSRSGRNMTKAWMRSLADHYQRYGGERVHCIAPDVYLDPVRTIRNWQWWQDEIELPIVPVIQFKQTRRLDVYTVMQQARFYTRWRPSFVTISNPGLRAVECQDVMPTICQLVRQITGCEWLHNLGAGWDVKDIQAWAAWAEITPPGFDSIDSIAYYTAAQGGERWFGYDGSWQDTAVANARYVAEMLAAERATQTAPTAVNGI